MTPKQQSESPFQPLFDHWSQIKESGFILDQETGYLFRSVPTHNGEKTMNMVDLLKASHTKEGEHDRFFFGSMRRGICAVIMRNGNPEAFSEEVRSFMDGSFLDNFIEEAIH